MAYTTINKSTDYFNTKLWTGNSSTQSITGNDFTADFTWSKTRSNAESHILMDTVRDAGTTLNQALFSNSSNAEGTLNNSSTLTVNSTGFDLSGTTGGALNFNGYTYATWLWRAGGHTGSANTDGSITTTVSANTTAGFSIVKWNADNQNPSTIGHGLGVAPNVIIMKETGGTSNWVVGGFGLDWSGYLLLDSTNAFNNDSNDTSGTGRMFSQGGNEPTSTVWYTNSGAIASQNGTAMIAYCFAEKTGFSKFGDYTGNGNADGAFLYTGFKPAFVIIKSKGSGTNWRLVDNKRDTLNPSTKQLFPNTNAAETTDSNYSIDFLSNGFKLRNTNSDLNQNAVNYIYMAFAEAPIVSSNGVPAVAR